MTRTFHYFFVFLMGMMIRLGHAQLPATDIWLVNIKSDTISTHPSFSLPVRIKTGFRYNNQPAFTSDGQYLLFAASTDSLQTDIYSFSLTDSTITRLTTTEESEFSPVMYETGKISVVRVEKNKAQRLYVLDKDMAYEGYPLVHFNDSVAYYGWAGKDDVALTVLDHGKTALHFFNIPSQQYILLRQEKTGRCFARTSSGEICFVIKETDSTGMIVRFDPVNEIFVPWCPLLTGSEDFIITPDDRVWMGNQGKLYEWNAKESLWQPMADFSKTIGPFYRLAISPDNKRLALVSYSGRKP
jgi:hypothetical protein